MAKAMKKERLKVTDEKDIPYAGENPKTGLPQGVDQGWDYQPGASLIDRTLVSFSEKMEKQNQETAVATVSMLVNSPVFHHWLEDPQGHFPLAVLSEPAAAAIGAKTRVAHLSPETVAKQQAHHPELTPDEYAQAQHCVDQGERIQDSPLSLIYFLEETGYVTVVKATKTGEAVFVTSFRRLSEDAAKRGSEIRRLRRKKT
jgi:hypothetical protein